MNILEFIKNLFSKNKKTLNIISTDMTMKEGNHEQLEVALYENRTPIPNKDLIININTVDYTRTTDSDGVARLNINLPKGVYPVTIRFIEDGEYYGDTATCTVYVTDTPSPEPTPTPTPTPTPVLDKHYGYWVFGRDMLNVDLNNLKNHGVTDIFLNYYALTVHGRDKVINWIQQAQPIHVHIWMQCFYDGEWHNPATTDLTNKIEEAKSYAELPGIAGVHLDYLRYPGNAYKTPGGTEAINNFVQRIREETPDNIILSCAIMPENSDKYYYGQDIEALGQLLDCILPMQYKGNYQAGTEWLASTTREFSAHAHIWSGLQSYKSDDNPETLSEDELQQDIQTCLENGAEGAILFRYGLSPDITFPHKTEPHSGDKTPTILDGTNVNMQYRDGTQYMCAVYANNTRINVPVDITINGRTYTRTPDNDGLCRLNINLLPGTYTVKTEFHGDNTYEASSVTNTVIINQNIQDTRMEGTDINMTEHDGTVYQCAIYSIPENVRVYDTVNITVNGRTYTRTADNGGLYKLNINLPVGTYNIRAEFPGNNTYNPSSIENSIIINPKPPEPQGCTNPYESSPHPTEPGCNGRGQNNSVCCGPSSIHKAIYKFGIRDITQGQIAEWAGTGSGGTDHDGINTAIAKIAQVTGTDLSVDWYNFSELGWETIGKIICQPNKAVFCHILYQNGGTCDGSGYYGHYEALVKVNTETEYVKVINSLGDYCGSCYCGYYQDRSMACQEQFINGISQKSICVITKN